jgi:hypothetical protein
VDSAWEQEKPEARKILEKPQNPQRPVHLRKIESHHVSPKKQGRNGSILQIGRRISRTKQWRRAQAQSRGAPWFPIKMMYPLVALMIEFIEI